MEARKQLEKATGIAVFCAFLTVVFALTALVQTNKATDERLAAKYLQADNDKLQRDNSELRAVAEQAGVKNVAARMIDVRAERAAKDAAQKVRQDAGAITKDGNVIIAASVN